MSLLAYVFTWRVPKRLRVDVYRARDSAEASGAVGCLGTCVNSQFREVYLLALHAEALWASRSVSCNVVETCVVSPRSVLEALLGQRAVEGSLKLIVEIFSSYPGIYVCIRREVRIDVERTNDVESVCTIIKGISKKEKEGEMRCEVKSPPCTTGRGAANKFPRHRTTRN